MIILVVYFLIQKFHPSSTQFPNHVDFQKVGEVNFNNEHYNVLKPTVHMVRDYFKDHVLRRQTSDFPTKRVFIDHNGFRHYWGGIENTLPNLRKSDAIDTKDTSDVNKNTNDILDVNNSTDVVNTDSNNDPLDASTNTNDTLDVNITTSDAFGAKHSLDVVNTVSNNETDVNTSTNIVNTVYKPALRKLPLRKKKLLKLKAAAPMVLRSSATRTLAKTTFFCPFFGVVTMTSILD